MVGKTKHPLYKTWCNMISRCYIEGASSYKNYGGRGISVCDKWRKDFWSFVSDMGLKPSPEHSIDRIDVNGNYEPSNCKWSTKIEQARNMRNARIVLIEGKSYHVAELQDQYGVDMRTIYYRSSLGWPLDKVISKERFYNNSDSQKKAVLKHAEIKRAKTHCKYGHEFSNDNVYEYKGRRACKKCKSAWSKYIQCKKTQPLSNFL